MNTASPSLGPDAPRSTRLKSRPFYRDSAMKPHLTSALVVVVSVPAAWWVGAHSVAQPIPFVTVQVVNESPSVIPATTVWSGPDDVVHHVDSLRPGRSRRVFVYRPGEYPAWVSARLGDATELVARSDYLVDGNFVRATIRQDSIHISWMVRDPRLLPCCRASEVTGYDYMERSTW